MSAPSTGTTPADRTGSRPGPSEQARPAPRVPRGQRRTRGQLALAVLLIVGCAALAAALYAGATKRTTVVVAAREIPMGAKLGEQDLRAAEISGAGVAAIGGEDAARLLGQTATTTIPAGTLINVDMVADAPPPGPGNVAVGLALAPGRLPSELAAGRDVQVLLVPAAQDTGTQPEGAVLVDRARVLSVSADPSGAWLVSLAVGQGSAAAVTSAAAVDRVAVSMLPVGEG